MSASRSNQFQPRSVSVSRRFAVALTVTLLFAASGLQAIEKVVMKNGVEVEGIIIEETDTYIRFRRANSASTLRLNKDLIAEIVREEGMSLEETLGDNALAKRDFDKAREHFKAALATAENKKAQKRLNTKIKKSTQSILATSQQEMDTAFEKAVDAMRQTGFRNVENGLYILKKFRERALEGITDKNYERQIAYFYFAKATSEMDRLQYTEAEATLDKALKHDEGIAALYLMRGRLLEKIAGGDQYNATDAYLKGLELAPDQISEIERADYEASVGRLLIDQGKLIDAKEHLLTAGALDAEGQKEALLLATDVYLAVLNEQRDELTTDTQAITELKSMIAISPNSMQGLQLKEILADVLTERGECAEAITTLESILAMDRERPGVNHNIAVCWARQAKSAAKKEDRDKALANAEQHFRAELRLNPMLYETYRALAQILEETNRLEKAQEMLSLAIRIEPKKAAAYTQILRVEKALGDAGREVFHDRAMIHADELVAIRGYEAPESLDAMMFKASILVIYHKKEEATTLIDAVQQVLSAVAEEELSDELRETFAISYMLRGMIGLYDDGLVNMAEGEFKRAVELDPDNADAHAHLAEASRRLGVGDDDEAARLARYRSAEANLLKAIELKPAKADYYRALGELYFLHLKELEKAKANLNRYKELGGTDPDVDDTLAKIDDAV